jgi:hypothetical protein
MGRRPPQLGIILSPELTMPAPALLVARAGFMPPPTRRSGRMGRGSYGQGAAKQKLARRRAAKLRYTVSVP